MVTLDQILARLSAAGVEIVQPVAKSTRASRVAGSAKPALAPGGFGSEADKHAACAVACQTLARTGCPVEASLVSGLPVSQVEAIAARYADGWKPRGDGALDEKTFLAVGVMSHTRDWQTRFELWGHVAHSVAAVWGRGGSVEDAVQWFAVSSQVADLRQAAKKDFGADFTASTRQWFQRLFSLYVIAPAHSLARVSGKALTLQAVEVDGIRAAWGDDWAARLDLESRVFDDAWVTAAPGEIVRPHLSRKKFLAVAQKVAAWKRRGKSEFSRQDLEAWVATQADLDLQARQALRCLSALPGLQVGTGRAASWTITKNFPCSVALGAGAWIEKTDNKTKKTKVPNANTTKNHLGATQRHTADTLAAAPLPGSGSPRVGSGKPTLQAAG